MFVSSSESHHLIYPETLTFYRMHDENINCSTTAYTIHIIRSRPSLVMTQGNLTLKIFTCLLLAYYVLNSVPICTYNVPVVQRYEAHNFKFAFSQKDVNWFKTGFRGTGRAIQTRDTNYKGLNAGSLPLSDDFDLHPAFNPSPPLQPPLPTTPPTSYKWSAFHLTAF